MQELLIDQKNLYRLPWTLPDNAISWLEPTSLCNLSCDGCYRENEKNSHKSLDVVKKELDVFVKLRITDGVSIAGGDPLLHPDIIEIVREVAKRNMKPIINTNGLALTKELLLELKKAGVFGFTFHIDSKQNRPQWKDKNELELNELRLKYAQMLAEAGNISCSFNATVYEDTLKYVPELVEWAQKHIDIVQVMVFIAYRQIVPQMPMDWYAGGKKVEMNHFWYSTEQERKVDILSTDVLARVKEKFPEFNPCAYLNGTEKPDSYKWLLSIRIGNKHSIMGYMGNKFIEMVQTQYHFWQGKYLAYAAPGFTKLGKSSLLLWPLDKGLRKAAGRFLKSVFINPLNLFRRLHFQSIMMIQPVDFMEDGGQNMCDGCPDITVWEDKLVWSCRLEEPKKFGCFVRTVPRKDQAF
ncbi:MAG: radical SAM protein [Ignavibacteria bacterium]|jgi:organic radical activating enzyme|nr:radical SAM protein [Ignavibacteria bacterium]MCU7503053.1 radical SAM protein [Ignavibacteria bacterium]MCU7516527.1 radical SAM protein [Ignavibacteria bacterium]